jgi:NADH-quinone oxidoreductase subunit F
MTATGAPPFQYIRAFPRERTYVLPALHLLHEHEGYLSPEGLSAVALHFKIPNSELYGVACSYSEFSRTPGKGRQVSVCTGLSCLLNGAAELVNTLSAAPARGAKSASAGQYEVSETPCRFLCNLAPVVAVDHGYVVEANPGGFADAIGARPGPAQRPTAPPSPLEVRRVTARCGVVDPSALDTALAAGGYEGLKAARRLSPAQVTERVSASGLQGRGGAYFPAGRKWETARLRPRPRYFVVNAEEGEPGVFKDRFLLEKDPHLMVEGLLIAAHAIEAERVFVYINGEALLATARLEAALADAKAAGLFEGTEVEVRRGAGGYVCGEESVILSSIEGERAVPRLRPPLPVESGLWGRPTVINNVETVANLPFVLTEGPDAFRLVGTESHPGTKALCLSGAVRRPGIYEVPLGTTVRSVVEDLGGGARPGHEVRAVLCGGPSGGLLPPSKFDTPLVGGSLDPGGAALGAGGIVVIDDSMLIRDVLYHLAAYNAAESCGKCTPCREGAPRMRDLIGQLRQDSAPPDAIDQLDALDEAMASASLCGLGQMAPLPYRSVRTHFFEELTRP